MQSVVHIELDIRPIYSQFEYIISSSMVVHIMACVATCVRVH